MPPICVPEKSMPAPKAWKPFLISSTPRKISATPTSTRPNAPRRSPKKPIRMPNTIIGSAAGDRLMFCPAAASSHTPPVAPRLVPKIIAIPPASEIIPELKNAIASSATSVLDCNTSVAPVPNSTPLNGVEVDARIQLSSRPPAALRSPSSMFCIPNRNSASP